MRILLASLAASLLLAGQAHAGLVSTLGSDNQTGNDNQAARNAVADEAIATLALEAATDGDSDYTATDAGLGLDTGLSKIVADNSAVATGKAQTKAVSKAVATPEPTGVVLAILAGCAMALFIVDERRRKRSLALQLAGGMN